MFFKNIDVRLGKATGRVRAEERRGCDEGEVGGIGNQVINVNSNIISLLD